MDRQSFRQLPTDEAAAIVREHGPIMCGFPINGTRRWVMLEGKAQGENFYQDYMLASSRAYVRLYKLLFDHGIDTVLSPIFGAGVLERPASYQKMASEGMAWLVEHEIFTEAYDACQARVGFYGDYHHYLDGHPQLGHLPDLFDSIREQTADHDQHRLLYGVFAQDATRQTLQYAVDYHAEHGELPTRDDLIEMYYGERLPSLSFYIGFEFTLFDVPLVTTGYEHLYYTVSPSPYLTAEQLRDILYDHLFARADDASLEYEAFTAEDWANMRNFYRTNQGNTVGIGRQRPHHYWHPLPQIEDTFEESS